jgi:hypothetical protein
LDDFPKECACCGKERGDGTGFDLYINVNWDGTTHRSAVCNDCIRAHIMNLAYSNREKFEEMVKEAREWKPEQSE